MGAPPAARTVANPGGCLGSRSWSRRRTDREPSRSLQVTLRACWVSQEAAGWGGAGGHDDAPGADLEEENGGQLHHIDDRAA